MSIIQELIKIKEAIAKEQQAHVDSYFEQIYESLHALIEYGFTIVVTLSPRHIALYKSGPEILRVVGIGIHGKDLEIRFTSGPLHYKVASVDEFYKTAAKLIWPYFPK